MNSTYWNFTAQGAERFNRMRKEHDEAIALLRRYDFLIVVGI